MQNMQQEGRELMKRAEEAMKAGQVADDLRQRLAKSKTVEDREWIKRNASDCRGLYPAHAARFAEIMAEVDAAAKQAKKPRKLKDTRPLPDRHIKAQYANKMAEVVGKVESNREAARQVYDWAVDRGNKDATFAGFRVLKDTALQELAAKIRAKRRKR